MSLLKFSSQVHQTWSHPANSIQTRKLTINNYMCHVRISCKVLVPQRTKRKSGKGVTIEFPFKWYSHFIQQIRKAFFLFHNSNRHLFNIASNGSIIHDMGSIIHLVSKMLEEKWRKGQTVLSKCNPTTSMAATPINFRVLIKKHQQDKETLTNI